MSLTVDQIAVELEDMPQVDVLPMDHEQVYLELKFGNNGEQPPQFLMLLAEPQLLIQVSQAIFTAVMLHEERERSARIAAEAADLAEVE